MHTEVVFAGFGGQGVLLIGQMLAYAGLEEGRNVSWLPSYGPEMRGGTAYCTVIVSDRAIGSPILGRPGNAAVLNRPSLEKFSPRVRRGGVVVINTSLIHVPCEREDVVKVNVPANDIAIECGSGKAANMAILGAFVGFTRAVSSKTVGKLIEKQFAKKPKIVDLNLEVLRRGLLIGEEALASRSAG